MKSLSVPPEGADRRLDRFLAEEGMVLSRAFGQKLIRSGHVSVNGAAAKASLLLEAGDRVTVELPPPEPSYLEPEPMDLDVRHEDDDILVINKPAGLVVHPGAGVKTGTLVHGLLHHCSTLSGGEESDRPGIVHRLDRDTTGLLVVAKHPRSHARLGEAMRLREIRRQYVAVVWGIVDEEGVMDSPIGRSHRDRRRMAVTAEGRHALTRFSRREQYRFASLVDVSLETGRTHQIRVHFSHANHPVMGDETYGGRNRMLKAIDPRCRKSAAEAIAVIPRQALHAAELSFRHPVSGEEIHVTAELPPDIGRLIDFLRKDLAAASRGTM